MLRTSERNLFKRCQWAWQRGYQDRLKYDGKESVALWFGTGIHLAMEHWYIPGTARGRDPRETWIEYVDQSRGDTEWVNTYMDGDFSEAVTAKELGVDMLTQYLEEYGDEPHIEVLASELSFQIPIEHNEWTMTSDPSEGVIQRTETDYVGTIDLVIRDHSQNGKIFLLDFKTAKALGSFNTQYLPLDDQAGAYCAFGTHILRKKGLIEPNEAIQGIIYSYLVKAKADQRPKNADGFATNKPKKEHYIKALTEAEPDIPLDKLKVSELASLAEDRGITVYGDVSANQPKKNLDKVMVYRHPKQRRSQVVRVQRDLEAMSLVRNNLLAATKTPTRECGFCEFREICELDESGKDWTDFAEMMYTTWDPYSSHRKKQ